MTFSEKKTSVLGKQKGKGTFTFLLALSCAAAIILPYIITGEGYFTLFGDFNSKIIPFYKLCHGAIREGNLGWSFNTGTGADFIGYYSFYLLGDPFFLITLPFNNGVVPYLIGPIVILEFACAALAAYAFIRRFTRTPEAACIGGLLYAFSGFSVCGLYFGNYFEAIILLPLLLLSMELLITEGRRGVFALCMALSAANCLFFIGAALFAAVYFFVRALSGDIKLTVWRFLSLVIEGVAGALTAAVLFVPFILALAGSLRLSDILPGSSGVAYGDGKIYLNILRCFFFPPEMPGEPLFSAGSGSSLSPVAGWLPLFGMAGAFAYLKNRKGGWLKRMLIICAFIAFIPILNGIFSASLAEYRTRWFYMPILLICLMTASVCEDTSADLKSGTGRAAAVTLAFAAVIGLFPQEKSGKIVPGLFADPENLKNVIRLAVSCLTALICVAVCALIIKLKSKNPKAFIRAAVAGVCIVSVLYSHIFILAGRERTAATNVITDHLIDGEVTLPEGDDYRVDVYGGIENTGMYLGFPSPGLYADAAAPASLKEFYEYTGVSGGAPGADYAAMRSLLSVKYLLNDKALEPFRDENGETEMPGYSYLKTQNGYHVFENDNYIGYGFSYDYYMTYDFCENYSGSMRCELMLKAILLDDKQAKKYRHIMTNITFADPDLIYNSDIASDAAALKYSAATRFDTDKSGFTAKVQRENKSLVFFSVPYSEGWSATVNGEPAEIEKVNAGFMAVAVSAGNSVIRFDYRTPGLDIGIYVSLISLFVFLIYFIITGVYGLRHKAKLNFPEGDRLLDRWSAEIAPADEQDDALTDIPSLLDKLEDSPPQTGALGGFKVDTSAFDEQRKQE